MIIGWLHEDAVYQRSQDKTDVNLVQSRTTGKICLRLDDWLSSLTREIIEAVLTEEAGNSIVAARISPRTLQHYTAAGCVKVCRNA